MDAKTAKDDLYEKAKAEFNITLDRRMKLVDLEEQVRTLEKNKLNPPPKPVVRRPKTLQHIVTGYKFSYDKCFAGNPNLEIVEWEEDDNGDN